MIDYKLANSLALEAQTLWGFGRLAEAADRYERAIALVESFADWHCAYAGVLQQLGRHEESTRAYETALALELTQVADESAPSLRTVRHFLADHLTKQGDAARALEVLAPAVRANPGNWLIEATMALALLSDGQMVEARASAERAIANAGSAAKKVELTKHLKEVFDRTPD